ncbi:MAG: hypothetical protein I8H75_05750 [Myxococcaceae bacterium]|nr:hypothetical protein [Myxococcaceae bacterium]MBH2006820.1 hypothetical protein [Myxococcaceae bacterium]
MLFHDRFANAFDKKRLPHALLFIGEEQDTLVTTAVSLTAGLLCDFHQTPSGCEQCLSCRLVQEKKHTKAQWLQAEGEIKIDAIRDLVSAPGSPNWVIPNAHRMNRQASNALLKTLEEPHSEQHYILLAPSVRALLPTIVSRCQRFYFQSQQATDTQCVDLPKSKLERMALAEQLAKDKPLLEQTLDHWVSSNSEPLRFGAMKAQAELRNHLNPQLILEELLFSLRF